MVHNVGDPGLVLLFAGPIMALSIGVYLLQAIAYFALGRKAGVTYSWLSFIPLLQVFVLLAIVSRSAWNALWLLIPIVNAIFVIIWYVRLFRAFGQNPWWLLLLLVPGINGIFLIVILCYMAFSSQVAYNSDVL